MSDTTKLTHVSTDRAVKGPRRGSVNTIQSREVDALYLVDDLVAWEKGSTLVYIPLANVCYIEVDQDA